MIKTKKNSLPAAQFLGVVIALFLSLPLQATDYYVSNTGEDTHSGLSPSSAFRTLKKAGDVIKPGDKIYLERGSIFYSTFTINKDNITLTSYGEGELPVISNELELKGPWRRKQGTLWELKLKEKLSKVYGLYRNGKRLTLGRYPEKTNSPYSGFFSRYDRLAGNYLKDTTGLWRVDDFTGAEVAVRPNRWYLEVYKILAQNDTALILDANITEKKFARDLGYFFIHHPKFCDEEGEWAYDTETGTLYLNSSTDPNKNKFTTLRHTNGLTIENVSNVRVKGIKLEGSGLKSIAVNESENVEISNCEFTNGGRALFVENSSKIEINHCKIRDMYMSGIVLLNSPGSKVMQNDMKNIGTLGPIHDNGDKMWHFTGIYSVLGDKNRVEGNRIVHCGYSGINITGKDVVVRRNYVDAFNTLIDDGGGIYTHGGDKGSNSVGLLIENNIVVNSLGNPGGGPQIWGKPHTASSGIYIDDRQRGITIKDNIVAHITHYGIFFKGMTEPPYRSDVVVEGNLFFNCETELLIDGNFRKLKHYFKGAKVVNNQFWDIDGSVPQNTEANVKFWWENDVKKSMSVKVVDEFELKRLEMEGNTLVTFQEKPVSYQDQLMTIAEFNQTDLNPSMKVIKLDPGEVGKVKLLINNQDTSMEFELDENATYKDAEGNKYQDKLILEPFSARVLIKQ